MVESDDLVRLSQQGDQAAFGQLVKLHHGHVYGQILRMTRNAQDAQEIAQLAWIKVWNKIGTFRFESAFSSWLYRVATFTALDALRKRRSLRETPLETDAGEPAHLDDPSMVAPPEQISQMDRNEIKERFQQALETLPSHHREALILREQDGLTYQEIADRLHCKTGTVMSRLFNARKAIQNQLKDLLP